MTTTEHNYDTKWPKHNPFKHVAYVTYTAGRHTAFKSETIRTCIINASVLCIEYINYSLLLPCFEDYQGVSFDGTFLLRSRKVLQIKWNQQSINLKFGNRQIMVFYFEITFV